MAWVRTYTTKVDETVSVEGDTIAAADINNPQTDINGLQRIVETDSATAPTWSDMRVNATYDGSDYNRTDTAKAAGRLRLDVAGRPYAQRVASAANPITWAASGFPFPGYIANLVIRTASTTTFVVSWDWAVLFDNTNKIYKLFPSGSVTINIAAAGANGLDTGSIAANTLYYISIIGKHDAAETLAGIIHLASGTLHQPTMPSGYVFGWTVSFFKSNGSSQIHDFAQKGDALTLGNPYTHIVVNGTIPNSTNIQTAAMSSIIPAGLGRTRVSLGGLLGGGTTTHLNLTVQSGDTTGAAASGVYTARAHYTAADGLYSPIVNAENIITDGSPSQNIKWAMSNADAGMAAYIFPNGAHIPTVIAA